MRVRRPQQPQVQRRLGRQVVAGGRVGRQVGGEPGPAGYHVGPGRRGLRPADGALAWPGRVGRGRGKVGRGRGSSGRGRRRAGSVRDDRCWPLIDRSADRPVAGAAADVPLERPREVLALPRAERRRRHDHSGRAEAALESLRGQERVLQRVRRQPFDRRDRAAGRADGGKQAAVHRHPVHVHRARAAVARVAALLDAEPAVLPQERAQALAGARLAVGRAAVDDHRAGPGFAASSAITPATQRRVIAARQGAAPCTSSR